MPDLPTYVVKRATAPIRIDGHLDEADWQAAEPIPLRETETGRVPNQATSVRALWDDDFLYVGFHCIDASIWSPYVLRNDPLWEQEVVEVFIDDNGNGITYLEYEINPRNALVDLSVINRDGNRDTIRFMTEWDSLRLRHAAHVDGDPARNDTADRSWTVEWAIPWEDFATAPNLPPRDGDTFRANFYRIDRDHRPGAHPEDDEYSAWSPTGAINFHVPKRFGTLAFSTETVRS
jgi:hypothetical protein